MRRLSRFFLRQLITALAVAVPLVVLVSWALYRGIEDNQQNAYREVQARSRNAAHTVETALHGAERTLTFVATHQDVRGLDPARCSGFLRGLEGVDPRQAVVSVLDRRGRAVCSSVDGAPGPAEPDAAWFERAAASDGFQLGKPTIDASTGRAVVPLSLAVRDAGGARAGLAVVGLDLLRLQDVMVGDWPADGTILALVDTDLRFLVRSPDTLRWMGREASPAARSLRAGPPGDIVTAKGVDGVERVFASTPMSSYGLRAVASIPAAVVFGRGRAEIRAGLAVAVAGLLLAGVLAYGGARSLARPVESLVGSARDFAAGRPDARADEQLPSEFKDLAIGMNAMHEARTRSEASASASERRVLRMARFYEAASRANQAIVRLRAAADLYDSICQVCVETGQASMSWIGVIEGQRLVPVAWGGPARAYTQRFELDIIPLAQPGSGRGIAGVGSVLEGSTRVVADYMNDPRTLPFRENASVFGVRSSAIVPFSRAGVVVGTLNLYASEVDFFDEELMRLLVEMGADISFALDSLDRAAAHARTEEQLRERESQLSGIVESAMDAIITVDANRIVRVFNGAAVRMFQVTQAEAVGHTMDRFIPERLRPAHAASVAAFAGSGISALGQAGARELTGRRADGEEFPMEASISRMNEGDGVQMTVVIRDITGRRDAEAARLAASEADASNRAKSIFLARMSHELRTPLNAVLGFSQLLQPAARLKLNERECHQLDLIFQAGTQLRALVDDVLDASAIESGRLSLALGDFDLATLLDGVVRMSEGAAREADVRLLTTYADHEPMRLHSDPVRLRQVALNLVSNAIKYNRPGGSVTLGMQLRRSVVRITVADTGLGMTEAQIAGLFQPFNRLGRETSGIAGSGIGMALVRQLVELLGGSVSVSSEAGIGTTVRVDLPRAALRALPPPGKAPSPAPELAADSAPGLAPAGLVLYIEDNPVNLMIVQHVLLRWPDVQFVAAEDGATGIRKATALLPDVVLLDMQLPDMSGLDVLAALRGRAETRDLAVVALSANTQPDDVIAARAAGAQDYWTKPIVVESFCAGMRALLAASQGVPSEMPAVV